MTKLYQKLSKLNLSAEEIKKGVSTASLPSGNFERAGVLKSVFSFMDLTSLNSTDYPDQIRKFTGKAASFKSSFPDMNNVAAVCVFPNFVHPAREGLKNSGIRLAVVSGSFPTSQTFLEVKATETEIAVRNGADEIDIVMSSGIFLSKDYESVIEEIKTLRQVAGDATLKVILETGVLNDPDLIYRASVIAMDSGADFIKTSTGKTPVSATPEAVWIMCRAIKDYYNETGIMIGLKPAGGVSTPDEAIVYYNIVNNVLGEKWICSERFRFGTSRLANNILKELYPDKPSYF
jgi:deoxyribose-phosphate aldolase